MSLYRKFRSVCTSSFLVLCFLSLPSGCGGGTTGTGGSSGGGFGVTGSLRSGGAPVSGAQVSVAPAVAVRSTSAVSASAISSSSVGRAIVTDVTDANGAFMLEVDGKPTVLSLRFKGDRFDSVYTLQSIPSAAANVVLDLQLIPQTDAIEASSEKYEDENGNQVEDNKGSAAQNNNQSGQDKKEN